MEKVNLLRVISYSKEKGKRKPSLNISRLVVDDAFKSYPEKVKASIVLAELHTKYGDRLVRLESFDLMDSEAYLIDGKIFTPAFNVLNEGY